MLASFLKRDLKNLIQRDASPNFQAQNGLLSLRSWWRSVRSLFYLDVMRGLLFVFIPVAVIIALFLVAQGTPMTFDGIASAKTLDGAATKMESQSISRGPVAALVAIKQAGTNGGGFFGPNSTHPFENPTAWTN